MFAEFVKEYGTEILMAIVTFIGGFIGLAAKSLFTKLVNDKTKKSVAKTVVQGVEQVFKDLHGEEKLNKALEWAAEMLTEKGIKTSDIELRVLLEAAVGEFNENFKKTA